MPSVKQVVMADYVQQNNGVPSSARPLRGQACTRADPRAVSSQLLARWSRQAERTFKLMAATLIAVLQLVLEQCHLKSTMGQVSSACPGVGRCISSRASRRQHYRQLWLCLITCVWG